MNLTWAGPPAHVILLLTHPVPERPVRHVALAAVEVDHVEPAPVDHARDAVGNLALERRAQVREITAVPLDQMMDLRTRLVRNRGRAGEAPRTLEKRVFARSPDRTILNQLVLDLDVEARLGVAVEGTFRRKARQ